MPSRASTKHCVELLHDKSNVHVTMVQMPAANAMAPGLLDRYLARTGFSSQQTGNPPKDPNAPANLWEPADGPDGHDYTAHGSFDGRAWDRSAQLCVSHHYGAVFAVAGATVAAATGVVGAGAVAMLRARRR